MKQASLKKRFFSAWIDYTLLSVILYVIGYYYFKFCEPSDSIFQAAPFVLISAIVMPLDTMYRLLVTPKAYGSPVLYWIMIMLLFIIEYTFFILQEVCLSGCTIGKKLGQIRVVNIDSTRISYKTILIRNLLKLLSRYLCCIPVFCALFTVKRQTIYDIICHTIVQENR